jgi:AcrR family transcriptional regulator
MHPTRHLVNGKMWVRLCDVSNQRTQPYHHGNLRRALLDVGLVAVAEQGPAALSLREIARRAGVSHAAPTHHFRNKAGLLTAIAAEGWDLLADALTEAHRDAGFGGQGVAYVVFATNHPAHFAVMRTPDLLHKDDPALVAARERAGVQLHRGAGHGSGPDDSSRRLAAWALVHGLASLLLEGNIRMEPGASVEGLAEAVTRHLGPALDDRAAPSPRPVRPTR